MVDHDGRVFTDEMIARAVSLGFVGHAVDLTAMTGQWFVVSHDEPRGALRYHCTGRLSANMLAAIEAFLRNRLPMGARVEVSARRVLMTTRHAEEHLALDRMSRGIANTVRVMRERGHIRGTPHDLDEEGASVIGDFTRHLFPYQGPPFTPRVYGADAPPVPVNCRCVNDPGDMVDAPAPSPQSVDVGPGTARGGEDGSDPTPGRQDAS